MMTHEAIQAEQATPVSRRRWAFCFFVYLAAWYGAAGAVVAPGKWDLEYKNSKGSLASLMEAYSWLDGRMDLSDQGDDPLHTRSLDTCYDAATRKVYNFYPPLMTLINAGFLLIDRYILPSPTGHAGPWLAFTVLALPLIVVSYWAFVTVTRSPEWGAAFALVFLCATANYPLMLWARNAYPGYLAHLMAQVGMLLMVGDALGSRRFWPAAIGIPIAVWSRQMTIVYSIPVLILAWRLGRRRNLAIVAASLALAVGVQMGLNWAKFGSPLDSGYSLIFEGRTDEIAQRGRLGLFSTRWVPDNLWYMFGSPPTPRLSHLGLQVDTSMNTNSFVLSMPIAVLALAAFWPLRRDGWRMMFAAATVPVVGAILFYHAPGAVSTGCYRFGMDYFAVWFLVAAATLIRPKWRWWTLALAAYGLVYFTLVIRSEGIS